MDEQRREETTFRPDDLGGTGRGRSAGGTGSVSDELQELGRRLTNAARAAWESEQRQELQQEMTDGLRMLRDQLTDTVDSLRTHPRAQTMTQSMKEQVNKAAETTHVSEIVDDLRTGLAGGLRELNDLLGKLTTRLERRDEPAGSNDAATDESAVSSVGGPQITASTSQLLHGEQAGRLGESTPTPAGSVSTATLNEGAAPTGELPIAGAAQADLSRLERNKEPAARMEEFGQPKHQGLPAAPEGPENPSDQ